VNVESLKFSNSASHHNPIILIVDDDYITSELIKEGVKELGQVFHVDNGEGALEFCREKTPDVILMDVNMPSMRGTDVLSNLRSEQLNSDTPVIFITGDNSLETENQCWELGAADFINKPLSTRTLYHRVKSQLETKRMVDLLRRQATTDGLTGVQNRRFFDDFLSKQVRLSERTKQPISLLLLDIDFFKAYNDNFGHQLGDECLKAVATTIVQSVARESDCVARYGGEEFAVVLPDTRLKGAQVAAERIRQAIHDLYIPNPTEKSENITVSLGVVCGEADFMTPQEMVRQADENLYKAKQLGRDQFVI
jgi:diguanylate cyclase (GGDEF)-like protein